METRPPVPRAILVGIQIPGVDDVAHAASIEELGRLAACRTGASICARRRQFCRKSWGKSRHQS